MPLLGTLEDQLGDPPHLLRPACHGGCLEVLLTVPHLLLHLLSTRGTKSSRNRARLELGMSSVIRAGPATCASWDCNWATNACNLCTSRERLWNWRRLIPAGRPSGDSNLLVPSSMLATTVALWASIASKCARALTRNCSQSQICVSTGGV